MNAIPSFKLSGIAIPASTDHMLDEICEHFIEHADVERNRDRAILRSKTSIVRIDRKSVV